MSKIHTRITLVGVTLLFLTLALAVFPAQEASAAWLGECQPIFYHEGLTIGSKPGPHGVIYTQGECAKNGTFKFPNVSDSWGYQLSLSYESTVGPLPYKFSNGTTGYYKFKKYRYSQQHIHANGTPYGSIVQGYFYHALYTKRERTTYGNDSNNKIEESWTFPFGGTLYYKALLDIWEPQPHKTSTQGKWLNIALSGGWVEVSTLRSFGCTDVFNGWQGERQCAYRIVFEKPGNWTFGGELTGSYGKITFGFQSGVTRGYLTGSIRVWQSLLANRTKPDLVGWVVQHQMPNVPLWYKEADPYN
jgi:hypothetical protein